MTSKSEKEHMRKVAALGCIVCRNEGLGESPACLHHIKEGQGTAGKAEDDEVIPLCPFHHQFADGTAKFNYQVAYHHSPEEFEQRYGTQRQLLDQTMREVGA